MEKQFWVFSFIILGFFTTVLSQSVPLANNISKVAKVSKGHENGVTGLRHEKAKNSDEDSDETSGRVSTSQHDANKFVDELLEKFRARIVSKGFDRLSLPSESREFNKKIYKVRVHGEGRLYNGTLTGLDTVHRVHDAELNDLSNGSLRLDFDVQFDDLKIFYKLKLRFLDRVAQENLTGDLSQVTVHLRLLVNPNGHVTLDQFEITDSGEVGIRTRGVGPFNYVITALADVIGNGAKLLVLQSLEGRIKTLLSVVINESMYPTQALLAIADMRESIYQRFIRMTKVSRGFFGNKDE